MTERPSRPETIVLQGHRKWSGIWLGVALFGSASGTVMVAGGAWAGWFLLIVFLPSSVVLAQAIRPRSNELVLDATGYTIGSAYRRTTVPWRNVERIGTIEGAHHHQVVAVRFVPAIAGMDPESNELAAAMGGYHRTLPMDYGLEPEDLADLMRGYLQA